MTTTSVILDRLRNAPLIWVSLLHPPYSVLAALRKRQRFARLENMTAQPVSDQMALLRILDAAANRAREGLRVIEDWVRFALDDAHLTERLKQIRHDLAAALAGIPWEQRLAARETQADVGTGITTPSEHNREQIRDVLTANFLRLEEALRSLEEFGKIIDPAVGVAIEQLRYRTYTLQRAVDSTAQGSSVWPPRGSTSCWTGERVLRNSSGWLNS